ncbi:MAG: hypothetical protein K8F56_16845 [Rhodocyclaceae bacterium]|nr:hypothetical protein [Rhodocyclaceae bacterium]
MNFADIAPGALAWNEAASIDQTLSRPEWLPWVLIFDSESKNGAQSLARCFASVTVDDRRIDTPTSR